MRTFNAFAVLFLPITGVLTLFSLESPCFARSAPLEVDRLQDGVLYFRSSPSATVLTSRPSSEASSGPLSEIALQTNLNDAKLIGMLRPLPGGQPYALLIGRTCKDCLADPGLFALAPSGGKPNGYLYPGEILDSKTRAKVYESRGFFGHCLPSRKHDVLVIFQKEKVDKKHGLLSSVMIAEPALEHGQAIQDHLHETLLEKHLPRLNETLRLVRTQQCHELPRRSRVMLSRPLDIQIRNSRKLRDEDEDEGEEEDANTVAPKSDPGASE